MSWAVSWEPRALDEAAGFLQNAPLEVYALLAAVDGLRDNAASVGSAAWGSAHRRLRAGQWRVLYRIDAAAETVHVEHVGRADVG